MTTHIKVESVHTDDERWLSAGADAFAVHIAALVYCDRQLSEGRISAAMATRVSLAVPAERAGAAVATLVEHGFWAALPAGSYQIEDFHKHALPAEQIERTRARWKQDKDRRRQHALGDHALCKDPRFCPAIRSTVESTTDSTVDSTVDSSTGGSHQYQTSSDQTRPDRRSGSGNGAARRRAPLSRPRRSPPADTRCHTPTPTTARATCPANTPSTPATSDRGTAAAVLTPAAARAA